MITGPRARTRPVSGGLGLRSVSGCGSWFIGSRSSSAVADVEVADSVRADGVAEVEECIIRA